MKITAEGFAIIEGDVNVSAWVEQERRLDHDQSLVPAILPYIKPGATVIDVGAFIGDHTFAYLRAVGETGKVYAFEPNWEAFQCLKHNCPTAISFNVALGCSRLLLGTMIREPHNHGAHRVRFLARGDILCLRLHDFNLEPNFIKIDAEGMEVDILKGAEATILTSRPALAIEVNKGCMAETATSPDELYALLTSWSYKWQHAYPVADNAPMWDIIAVPNERDFIQRA